MRSTGKKRLDAAIAITTYAVGSGTASAVPTPGVELPRQLLLTASDILMYTNIWKIYFEEDLTSKGLLEILRELGLVTIGATGTAYLVTKATTAILKELSNWTGPLGWGVTAAIAGSLSGLFGLAWTLYCDHLYSQRFSKPA
ncbi:hypothetical protein JYQ62_09185 [Nostoc sp. UHCC 0702]|nr:hypothetical protein JYQ62_09185 [Nostoc sp. UHCC 0702]